MMRTNVQRSLQSPPISRRSALKAGLELGIAAAEFPHLLLASKGESTAQTVVETASGKIRGRVTDRVAWFKGVPYGGPTSGANRFQPPSKPQPWTGVRDADELGPRCVQPVRIMVPEMSDALTGHGPMSEDCLTLNVWTADARRRSKRPVMVWFHGGGFRTGWSGSALYDGTALARKHGVVVVSVNHRLNLFGFLYLAGQPHFETANAGLLDLVLALEWVRENIAGFGGDPGNVTIFGQSGGGGKVSNLLAMPRAKGLFHRAIVQSTISETALWGLAPEEANKVTETLLARLGLKKDRLGELQKLSTEQLLEAMNGSAGKGGGGSAETDRSAAGANSSAGSVAGDLSLRFVPVVDGTVLPANPFDPVAPEVSAGIPLMVGSVETEAVPYTAPNDAYWTTDTISDEMLRARVKRALGVENPEADRIIGIYKKNRLKASNMDLAMIVASDAGGLRTAGYTIAEHKAAQAKAPVYLYQFQWFSPVRQGRVRCMHGVELPFVFDHVDLAQWMIGTGPERQGIADQVSGAWAAFAHSGNPNHRGLPEWRPFSASTRSTLVFDRESACLNDPHREERLALAALHRPA